MSVVCWGDDRVKEEADDCGGWIEVIRFQHKLKER